MKDLNHLKSNQVLVHANSFGVMLVLWSNLAFKRDAAQARRPLTLR